MPQERNVNNIGKTRNQFSGDAWRASVWGGHVSLTDGIYLLSDNGSFIRINKKGIKVSDANIELLRGSFTISGGTFSIYGFGNNSDTYMHMSNKGLSAFKNGTTSFYLNAETGDVGLSGTIYAGAGDIGTWKIFPNGLCSSYSSYTIYLSPEYGINYNNNFLVDSAGSFSAYNGLLQGTISAQRGVIGLWEIFNDGLSAWSLDNSWTAAISSFTGAISSYTGMQFNYLEISVSKGINFNSKFFVDREGSLCASNAFIKGTISADYGYLGNLYVNGTLTGGRYYYDNNHYINLDGSSTSININDKFVVLSSGDVYFSNAYITGSVIASSGNIANWNITSNEFYKHFMLYGDNNYIRLGTTSETASPLYRSGKNIGYQIFNDGLSTNIYFDASFGYNLIKTAEPCGIIPVSGNFQSYDIERDPDRKGIQISIGQSNSAYTIFEVSTLANSSSLLWPDLKAIIAGWKFDRNGFYSCNNDFRITSGSNPQIIVGSSTSNQIILGVSGSAPVMYFGTTSNNLYLNNGILNLVANNMTANSIYVTTITGGRFFTTIAPTLSSELVNKKYVDDIFNMAITGITGISGSGSVGNIAKFSGVSSITNSIMSENGNNILINGTVSSDRYFSTYLTPIYNNESATKYYVDSLISSISTSQLQSKTLFLLTNASDITDYLTLTGDINNASLQTITTTISANNQLIEEFATAAASPNLTFIPSGYNTLIISTKKTGGTASAFLYAEVYKRDLGGSETLLFTTNQSENIVTGTTQKLNLQIYSDELSLTSSDRVVVKLYSALSGGGTNPTLELYVAGTTYSRLEFAAGGTQTVSGATNHYAIFNSNRSITSSPILYNSILGLTLSSNFISYGNVSATRIYASELVPNDNNELTTKQYVDNKINGTENYLAKFTSSGSIINSIVREDADGIFVEGGLAAAYKLFDIKHPSYDNEAIRLRHSAIETNHHAVVYRGTAKITNFKGIVKLPLYIKDLIFEDSITVSITPIGKIKDIYYMGIDFNKCELYFETEYSESCSFFWYVYGTRKDVDKLIVENLV